MLGAGGDLNDWLPMWLLWLLGTVAIWPGLGWYALHHRKTVGRWVCLWLMVALPLLLPWMAPSASSGLRFVLLIPGLLLMGKTWELATNRPSSPQHFADWRRFSAWALCPPEGVLCTDAETKSKAMRHGRALGMRGTGKILCMTVLLALNDAVELHDIELVSVIWMAFLMYFSFGGVVDVVGALASIFGVQQTDFLSSPVIARNPRDFWARRWNLWFTQTAHRLIFQPLGGSRKPIFAGMAVFAFSAIMHEYMVFVSLQRFDGRMLLFFGLHGLMTAAYAVYARGPGRTHRIPQPIAVGMHLAWFVATAPLFFGPVNEVFALSDWSLRGWI